MDMRRDFGGPNSFHDGPRGGGMKREPDFQGGGRFDGGDRFNGDCGDRFGGGGDRFGGGGDRFGGGSDRSGGGGDRFAGGDGGDRFGGGRGDRFGGGGGGSERHGGERHSRDRHSDERRENWGGNRGGGGGGGGGKRDNPDEQKRKLFVGGMSFDTTKSTVENYFGSFGDISEIIMVPHARTGKPRGFCFVIFKDEHVVDAVLNERSHNIDGRNVECTRAVGREEVRNNPGAIRRTKRVYVARTKDLTESDLKTYFEDFLAGLGTVEAVDLLKNRSTGQHRGFGFINFSSYEAVDKVCSSKNHRIGSQDVVAIKAEPKEERNERLNTNQYTNSLQDLRAIMPPSERMVAPALQASMGRTSLGASGSQRAPQGPPVISGGGSAAADLRRLEEEIMLREEQLRIKEMKLQLESARLASAQSLGGYGGEPAGGYGGGGGGYGSVGGSGGRGFVGSGYDSVSRGDIGNEFGGNYPPPPIMEQRLGGGGGGASFGGGYGNEQGGPMRSRDDFRRQDRAGGGYYGGNSGGNMSGNRGGFY